MIELRYRHPVSLKIQSFCYRIEVIARCSQRSRFLSRQTVSAVRIIEEEALGRVTISAGSKSGHGNKQTVDSVIEFC